MKKGTNLVSSLKVVDFHAEMFGAVGPGCDLADLKMQQRVLAKRKRVSKEGGG